MGSMTRLLASLFFYTRFLFSFSAIGFRRRAKHWPTSDFTFSGQTWIVTGATGGIGRAIAEGAAKHGARVIAVARSADKLATLHGMETAQVDLASTAAVRAFIASFTEPVDVLVNNVGVMLHGHTLTDESHETSFATNILNHFVLTEGLQSRGLLKSDGIVVNMSSGGMYGSPLKLEEMDAKDAAQHDGMAAYAMHKRAQVELTRWWNAEWRGRPMVYVMHPGWVDTEGVKSSLPVFRKVLRWWLRDAEQGADTALWLVAARPPAPESGIWLDRELHPEHAFSMTRDSPHTAADLAAYLRSQ